MSQPHKSVAELTIRDYFAAAVAGHIWHDMNEHDDTQTCARAVAQKAYIVADEMLIQRDKQ